MGLAWSDHHSYRVDERVVDSSAAIHCSVLLVFVYDRRCILTHRMTLIKERLLFTGHPEVWGPQSQDLRDVVDLLTRSLPRMPLRVARVNEVM